MRKKKILILVTFISCAHFIRKETYEREVSAIFYEGKKLYDKGSYKEAIEKFTQLLKNYPKSEYADDSWYMASLSFYRLKDYRHAIGAGEKLLKKIPNSPLVDETYLLLAEAARRIKDYKRASKYYIFLYLATDNKKFLQEAKNIISSQLNAKAIHELLKTFKNTKVEPMLLYYVGEKEYKEGKKEQAVKRWESIEKKYPESEETLKIKEFLPPKPGKIVLGVLLPFDGELKEFGVEVKKGVEFGKEYLNASEVKLEYFNTRSQPQVASEGAVKLAKQGVIGIIGPLSSEETQAVIESLKDTNIAILSPTATNPDLLTLHSCLFQLNSYIHKEIETLVNYAINNLSLRKFAVLYPEDKIKVAQEFRKIVEEKGGRIVYEKEFPSQKANFRNILLPLRNLDAEATFLPCNPTQIITIAPQIAYFRIKTILLGLEEFRDEMVLKKGEKYVENAIFVAPPYDEEFSSTEFDKFYESYKAKYGTLPKWSTILGFDAFTMIYKAMRAPSEGPLCKKLKLNNLRKGIIGRLTFMGNEYISPFNIYTIKEGKVEKIK